MNHLTHDEINLICIYHTVTRAEIIDELTAMRGYLARDERKLRELTDSVILKLHDMDDEEYGTLDLIPDFDA